MKYKKGDLVVCKWAYTKTNLNFYLVKIEGGRKAFSHKYVREEQPIYFCRFIESELCKFRDDNDKHELMKIYEDEIIGLKDDKKVKSEVVLDSL